MLDPRVVLTGQTIAYTIYVLVVMSIIGWFAYMVTRGPESKPFNNAYFYAYLGLLIVAGVSLHLLTRSTIPWKEMDLKGSAVQADKTFKINVADHKFEMPSKKLVIAKNKVARFDLTSSDLTYGFGVFRPDNSMIFQMQVVPGHQNEIVWIFDEPGSYTIRSTEYSGPKGLDMIERDAIQVTE